MAGEGLSASLWPEMLAMKQHEHGNLKSLKGHVSYAGGWTLLCTEEERKNKWSQCFLHQEGKSQVSLSAVTQSSTRNGGTETDGYAVRGLLSQYHGLLTVGYKCQVMSLSNL